MVELSYKDIIILHEDNHILVVVKPFSIPVQSDSSKDMDLLSMLKEYIRVEHKKEGEAYLGLVHRLDRVTGGVMVFGKTSKAASRLCESIKNGDFEKKYYAVVRGVPNKSKDKLVHHLKKLASKNIVYTAPVTTEGAKEAILEYRTIDSKDNTSLLSVKLVTGRSHQIRVQLNAIGNSIIGDQKYGEKPEKEPKVKLALWAYELKFSHPTTREKLVFRVGAPDMTYPWNLYDMSKHIEINIKS